MHVYVYACICICMHMHALIHIHICTCLCTSHMYVHTCTHKQKPRRAPRAPLKLGEMSYDPPRRDDSVHPPPDFGLGSGWVQWRGGRGWGPAPLYWVQKPLGGCNWYALVGEYWQLLLDRRFARTQRARLPLASPFRPPPAAPCLPPLPALPVACGGRRRPDLLQHDMPGRAAQRHGGGARAGGDAAAPPAGRPLRTGARRAPFPPPSCFACACMYIHTCAMYTNMCTHVYAYIHPSQPPFQATLPRPRFPASHPGHPSQPPFRDPNSQPPIPATLPSHPSEAPIRGPNSQPPFPATT